MRPSKPITSIRLQNSTNTIQYCPTPPLPPAVTDKPWWERLQNRQSQSNQAKGAESARTGNFGNSGDYGNFGNPINFGNSNRWTWTLIETDNDGSPKRHHLRRSPEGKLLLKEELMGKPYLIVAENVDRQAPAEPPTQNDRTIPSRPIANVQIGARAYIGVYTLPDGRPEMPATHAPAYHALQKRDGSWCFLPNRFTTIPESWEMYSYPQSPQAIQASEMPAANPPQPAEKTNEGTEMQQSKETDFSDHKPALRRAEVMNRSQACTEEMPETKDTSSSDHKPALRRAEVITGSQACTEVRRSDHPIPGDHPIFSGPANPLQPAQRTNERTETPETRNTSSSDHPITGSPDHPILKDLPIPSAAEEMNQLEDFISEFLICSDSQRAILALWILHTYCYQVSLSTPYLNIYSHVEQSGKSVCLAVLRGLCANPWWASGIPASTLTRKVVADRPTVLLDNWHTTFRGNDKHQVTGFLLNGCQDFQSFTLLEKGSAREVNLYCPKAFAGMASLTPSLAQRCIPIALQRLKPHEEVTPVFITLAQQTTQPYTSWMQNWTRDHLEAIRKNTIGSCYRKSLPSLSPHQQDYAQTLLGLAETIGGQWPQKVRAALLEILQEEQGREASSVQLLSDVRDAFAHHQNSGRIFTNELLEYLHSLDHRTWYEWNKGQPMTAHSLSSLLRKHFNIYSRSQRRDKQKRRGYQQSDFAEAWQRYLPAQQKTGSTHEDIPDGQGLGFRSPDVPITRSPDLPKSPHNSTHDPSPSQCKLQPGKSTLVSMSQFKAGWAKSLSFLSRFSGKATGLLRTTRT